MIGIWGGTVVHLGRWDDGWESYCNQTYRVDHSVDRLRRTKGAETVSVAGGYEYRTLFHPGDYRIDALVNVPVTVPICKRCLAHNAYLQATLAEAIEARA